MLKASAVDGPAGSNAPDRRSMIASAITNMSASISLFARSLILPDAQSRYELATSPATLEKPLRGDPYALGHCQITVPGGPHAVSELVAREQKGILKTARECRIGSSTMQRVKRGDGGPIKVFSDRAGTRLGGKSMKPTAGVTEAPRSSG